MFKCVDARESESSIRLWREHKKDLILRTFPEGVQIITDKEYTCSSSPDARWHAYREQLPSALEPATNDSVAGWLGKWNGTGGSFLDRNDLRQVLDFWYMTLESERKDPPSEVYCPVGRLVLSIISFWVDVRGDEPNGILTLASLLENEWRTNITALDVVLSGWPLFLLLDVIAAESGTPQNVDMNTLHWWLLTGGTNITSTKSLKVLGITKRSIVQLMRDLGFGVWPDFMPGMLLPPEVRRALASIPRLSKLARHLTTERPLAYILHHVQRLHVDASVCPPGTKLMSALSRDVPPFRLCVRRVFQGLDASAKINGDWPTCQVLRKMHRIWVGPLKNEAGAAANKCVIIDVGTHNGLCALAFAAHGCEVIAVDICEDHIQMMYASAVVNNFTNIHILQRAVTDNEGGGWASTEGCDGATPHQASITKEGTRHEQLRTRGMKTYVKTTTVDSILQDLGKRREDITMLKIDAEGHDRQILLGAEQLLRNTSSRPISSIEPPVVVFELSSKKTIENGKLLQFLRRKGFTTQGTGPSINWGVRFPHQCEKRDVIEHASQHARNVPVCVK